MRLVKSVVRLEAAAARAMEPDPARWCVVWSGYDERVDGAALQEGEYVAVDVYVSDGGVGARVERLCERVTYRADDLGVVYGEGQARIGRVVSINGELVEWEPDLPPAA